MVPLAPLILLACAGRDLRVEASPLARSTRPPAGATVVVFPARPVAPGADPLRDGFGTGHLALSGGYVDEPSESGAQAHVSARSELRGEAVAAERVAGEVHDWLADHVERRGWREVAGAGLPPPPVRIPSRGEYPGLGTDDQSLPRWELLPDRLPAELLADLPADAGLVLVPWVARAYTHDAGWFFGQQWGCDAGARLRVLIAAHDPRDGGALAWVDVDARAFDGRSPQPSPAELEALTDRVLARARRAAERHLP